MQVPESSTKQLKQFSQSSRLHRQGIRDSETSQALLVILDLTVSSCSVEWKWGRSTKKNSFKSLFGRVVAWPGVHPWCRSALTAKDRGSRTVKPADTQHVPSGLMHDNGTFLRLLLHDKSTVMIRQAAVRNCESTVRRKRRLRVLARGSKATESIRDAEIETDVSSVAGSGPKGSISFWVSGFFGSPSERSHHLSILHSSYAEQLPPASAVTETPRSVRFLVLAAVSAPPGSGYTPALVAF
ncbi:hypothetical protein FOXB_03843 [Fusarium oxysporum f. sp. conglutinans Fo5176]|uniref:Uncharacterized protein n=1 Tax=Fusarium oxysporum (strain Fo5176) TaxID=660025 RepID=F9FBR6_FUSOF|nr:hypothetical protein FOXB_03843 [Fusarium oxysporum f. sp. conglutinans Fo5176]